MSDKRSFKSKCRSCKNTLVTVLWYKTCAAEIWDSLTWAGRIVLFVPIMCLCAIFMAVGCVAVFIAMQLCKILDPILDKLHGIFFVKIK